MNENENKKFSNSNLRMSAEEKLAKGSRNLSHTSGAGMGNSNIDLSKYTQKANATQQRKKVGGVVLDVDTIQDVNNQKINTRDKRNKVIILILVLALIVSLVFLTITIINYRRGKAPLTCSYKIEGDASDLCEWLIDGEPDTSFNAPRELSVDTIYNLKSQLKVNSDQRMMLILYIDVKYNDKDFLIYGLNGANENLQRTEGTNQFLYSGVIEGRGTIDLFDGIDFTDSPDGLSYESLSLTVLATVTKV